MYRSSSYLLQHAYTVHRSVIDVVADRRCHELWEADLGADSTGMRFVRLVLALIARITAAYAPSVGVGPGRPTDTLIIRSYSAPSDVYRPATATSLTASRARACPFRG